MSGDLFELTVTTPALLASTGDRAWVAAMLDAEIALVNALAEVGMVSGEAATAVAAAARADGVDIAALGAAARRGGNPVIPLVEWLRARVGADHRDAVHRGATSQDILDTALMLVADRTLPLVTGSLQDLAAACADLAARHRRTLTVGRTLLQPALPMPFGLRAAAWLNGVVEAHRLVVAAQSGLAAQLGGAVGSLAAFGPEGPAVAAAFARHVGLPDPPFPWHTNRQRVTTLAGSLATAAGTADKISGDVALLMQPEIGELREPAAPGRGVSSAMPHKRNPVGAAAVASATRRVNALLPVVFAALSVDLERDLGGWQSEWVVISEILVLAGGAVERTAETVAGLEVDLDAMAAGVARLESAVALGTSEYLGSSDQLIDRSLANYGEAMPADRRPPHPQ